MSYEAERNLLVLVKANKNKTHLGNYNTFEVPFEKERGMSIGKEKRNIKPSENVPGPGSYKERTFLFELPSFRFGTEPRKVFKDQNFAIGPGVRNAHHPSLRAMKSSRC